MRDQKQKTAFQIFHFICKGKRRKIEMVIFFLFLPFRLTYVCLCFSILPHIIWNPSAWFGLCFVLFFFLASHWLSLMLDNSKKLARSTPSLSTQPRASLYTSAGQNLSPSWLSPRGSDAPTLNNPQIIPDLLNDFRSVRKHVPLRSKVSLNTTVPLPFFPFGKWSESQQTMLASSG